MINKDREKRRYINKLLLLEQNMMAIIRQEVYEILSGYSSSDIVSSIESLLEESNLKIENNKGDVEDV